jgi:predicted lipoprotein with Yx(FWY)xxD motif
MRTILLLSTMALTAVALTGPARSSSRADAVDARAAVTVRESRFGRILFDGKGFVLYAFTRDPKGRSACSGACATAWPPFLVTGKVRAGAGARGRLIGTTRRAEGKTQVTYAGRPLYYYVGDREPGQILCQDIDEFGGTWLVARADGTLVR